MLHRNPTWWTPTHEELWRRTAGALKETWANVHRPTGRRNGNPRDPSEASWEYHPWERSPAALEDALRFGYAARLRYAAEYPIWGDALESRLRLDWEAMFPDRRDEWKSYVEAMRFAWHHDPEN